MMRKIKAILKKQDKTGPTSAIFSARSHLHGWRQNNIHHHHYSHHRYQYQRLSALAHNNNVSNKIAQPAAYSSRFVDTIGGRSSPDVGRVAVDKVDRWNRKDQQHNDSAQQVVAGSQTIALIKSIQRDASMSHDNEQPCKVTSSAADWNQVTVDRARMIEMHAF